MKQFTEEELKNIEDNSFDDGYNQGMAKGFAQGTQLSNYLLRGKVANQKRELRRLNKMLNDIIMGALAQRGVERSKREQQEGK